jgi:hypothetical protein
MLIARDSSDFDLSVSDGTLIAPSPVGRGLALYREGSAYCEGSAS